MGNNETVSYGILRSEYMGLCLSLDKEDETERVPESKDELANRVRELNWEWVHDYWMR